MNVYDLNQEYDVYYSAYDRMVKKIDEDIYEAYRITVMDRERLLTINTINFSDITLAELNKRLDDCGLLYDVEDNQIVQKHDPSIIIESEPEKIRYVLADRLNMTGYVSDIITHQFQRVAELNEILLEHDIPITYTSSLLDEL